MSAVPVDSGAVRRPSLTWVGSVVHNVWLRLVVSRLLTGLCLVLIVSALTFALASLAPGDPVREMVGADGSPEDVAAIRASLGLDLPLYEQYWNWVSRAATGDLGSSIFGGGEVTTLIGQRIGVTLSLGFGALVVSVIIGLALGVLSAVRGGVMGRIIDGFVLLAYSIPSFWMGAMLVLVFAVQAGTLPATGYVPFADSPGEWLRSLVLPVAALSSFGIATVTKQMRDAMLEILDSEHIRMAKASGLSPASIVFRHALKNASVRLVTVMGVLAIVLLGGTVVIETVFAMPGFGKLLVEATKRHDLPVLQGLVVFMTVMVLVINLIVDLAYAALNPKVGAK